MTMNVLERVQRAIDRLQHRSRPAYNRIGSGGNVGDLPTSSSDTSAIAVATNFDVCSSPSPSSSTASTPTGRRHSNHLPTTSSTSSLVMMTSSSGRHHRRCVRRPRLSSGGAVVQRQVSYCDNDVEFDDPDDDEYFYDDCNGFVALVNQPLDGRLPISSSCDVCSRFDQDSCNIGSVNTMTQRSCFSSSFDENNPPSTPPIQSSSLPRSSGVAARRKTAPNVDGISTTNGRSSNSATDGCSPTPESRRSSRGGSFFDWRQTTKTTASKPAVIDDVGRRSASGNNGTRTAYCTEPTSKWSPPLTPGSPFRGLRSPISGRRLSGPLGSATAPKPDLSDDVGIDVSSTVAARLLPAVDDGCWSCPASPRVDCNGRNSSPLQSHAVVGRLRTTPPLGSDRHVQRRRELQYAGSALDSANPSPDRSTGRVRNQPLTTPSSSLTGGGASRSSPPMHTREGRVGALPSSRASPAAAVGEDDDDDDRRTNHVTLTSQSFVAATDGDVYVSRDHAATILRKMAILYETRQLCDVILVAGDHRVPAHKLVLSSASDYFAAAFSNDDSVSGDGSNDAALDYCNADLINVMDDPFAVEKTNRQKLTPSEFHISSEVDTAIISDVIAYIYTGRLTLQRQSIESILSLATMWRLDDVVRACCGYLGDNIRPSTCIGLLNFAAINECRSLYATAYQYILDNFAEVVATPGAEFRHQLSADDLVALLSRDDLNVPDERTVYRAAVAWLRHDVTRRRQYAVDLLANVRLPLLSPQFITDHVTSDRLLMDDKRCQEIVLEAVRYHLLPERRHFLHSPRTRPRKSTVGRLVVAGGGLTSPDTSLTSSAGDSINVEIYDPRTDKWSSVAMTSSRVTSWPPPHPATAMVGSRQQYGVAVDDRGLLYIVGGRDGLKTLNAVNAFDLRTGRWTIEQGLGTPRHGLGVVVLGGPMYAVGGHDGWSYLNNVERWDQETRRWTYVAPMPTARSTLGVVAIDNRLLAIGGRDGGSCLAVVERYSPHTDTWSTCAPLNRRRAGVSAAECNGFVYVVGGHDCSSPSNTTTSPPPVAATGSSKKAAPAAGLATAVLLDCVERYDPRADCWTFIAPISSPRDAVGACRLGDRIYVVGGSDGTRYVNTVESYDALSNEWKMVSSMTGSRAGPCIAMLNLFQPDSSCQGPNA